MGVRRFRVVLELNLGTGGPRRVALVGHVIHDSAVAAFGNVVVEFQLEPVEFVGGDKVAGVVRIDAGHRAVLYLPAGPDPIAFEVVPAAEVLAVKEQPPARGLLRVGKHVDLPAVGGWKTKGRKHDESERDQRCAFHGLENK